MAAPMIEPVAIAPMMRRTPPPVGIVPVLLDDLAVEARVLHGHRDQAAGADEAVEVADDALAIAEPADLIGVVADAFNNTYMSSRPDQLPKAWVARRRASASVRSPARTRAALAGEYEAR